MLLSNKVRNRCLGIACAATLLAGVLMLSKGMYMQCKAELAQLLIEASWNQRGPQLPPAKPWRWADMHAVAKLEVPELNNTSFVMGDASGEALAFGPGNVNSETAPGQPGHVVIAGHRDSHFEFLKDIQPGHTIHTEHYSGQQARYRVVELTVIDARQEEITIRSEQDWLTLVTCYPFNNLAAQGPYRLLVSAEPF